MELELVVTGTTEVSVAEDTCEHPQLFGVTDWRGTVIQCTACKKTALIPQHSAADRNIEAFAEIAGMVFGSAWVQRIQEFFGEYY